MNLVELDRALRQLRLSGMAAVLETRLRQAQTEKMLGQTAGNFFETIAIDSINRTIELERFLGGQVPPERIFLAHEQTELSLHLVASLPRNEAEHACLAGGRIEQTRQHFEHGCFSSAVGAEETDEFAFLDLK